MSWQLASFVGLGAALALGFAWYERSRPPARVLTLVAAMAALAVVGRIAFAPFPNVKPTTDIVLFSGYALGGAPGFAVGAVTALVSNIFFTHGPWTPWQMAAWGGVGIAGGVLGWLVRARGGRVRPGGGVAAGAATGEDRVAEPRELGRWPLALACGLAGLAFGLVMDLHLWTLGAEQTVPAYAAITARSLPFNVAHAAGNVVFCLLVGPPLVRALRRYRRRFEVRWAPSVTAGARMTSTAGVVAVALAVTGVSCFGAATAHADSSGQRAARYLVGSQNPDGGFGRNRGGSSGGTTTAEVALGLAAAGRNPHDVEREGRSVIEWTRRNMPSRSDTGGIERTILLLRAAGESPRRFAGRNLYAELLDRRRGDGSFDGNVSLSAFGLLALRASGERPGSSRVRGTGDWLAEQQHDDGGFALGSGESYVDITANVLEALAAAGQAGRPEGGKAVRFLEDAQADSGGFGMTSGGSANSQSTAWAVRGLVAAGHGGGKTVGDALAYLRRLQSGDGSLPYSPGGGDRVWATGQAMLAFEKQPFPVDPVPRRRQPPAESEPPPADEEGDVPAARGSGGDPTARKRRLGRDREHEGEGGAGGGSGPGSGAGPGTGPGSAGGGAPLGGSEIGFGPGPAAPEGTLTAPAPLTPRTPKAPPPPASANPRETEPPWRRFSDIAGIGTRPAAARRPGAKDAGRRSPAGAALMAIGILAAGLMVLTPATARGRRLWASVRRPST